MPTRITSSKAGLPRDSNAAASKKQILDKAKTLTETKEQIRRKVREIKLPWINIKK